MTFEIDTDNLENDDFKLTAEGDDLLLEHKPSGNTVTVDEDMSVADILGDIGSVQNRTSGLSEDGSEATLELLNTEEGFTESVPDDPTAIPNRAYVEDNAAESSTSENRVLSVPEDYSTIQDAIDSVEVRVGHDTIIDVADGHEEGHVFIDGRWGINDGSDAYEGFGEPQKSWSLRIVGNRDDPSEVRIDSLTAVGCIGIETPQIWGVEFQGELNPNDDEGSCVSANSCDQLFIGDCSFSDSPEANRGMIAYSSGLYVRNTNFGSGFDYWIRAKRMSFVNVDDPPSGSFNQARYQNSGPNFWSVPGGDIDSVKNIGLNLEDNRVFLTGVDDNSWGLEDKRDAPDEFEQAIRFIGNDVNGWRFYDFTDSTNRFVIEGKGWGNRHIEDLSGQTGDFDGQIRIDDGTNTENRGIPCTWDDDGLQWVPHDGSAPF